MGLQGRAGQSFDLGRFVTAQQPVYDAVRAELRAGRKRSHWMWFIFPQLLGLGRSEMARRYALGSLDEARAYLRDPVLGPRLRECVRLVLAVEGNPAATIFGSPDDLKFHSSMTLFAEASSGNGDDAVFAEALTSYFGGERDLGTLDLLQGS